MIIHRFSSYQASLSQQLGVSFDWISVSASAARRLRWGKKVGFGGKEWVQYGAVVFLYVLDCFGMFLYVCVSYFFNIHFKNKRTNTLLLISWCMGPLGWRLWGMEHLANCRWNWDPLGFVTSQTKDPRKYVFSCGVKMVICIRTPKLFKFPEPLSDLRPEMFHARIQPKTVNCSNSNNSPKITWENILPYYITSILKRHGKCRWGTPPHCDCWHDPCHGRRRQHVDAGMGAAGGWQCHGTGGM